MFEGPCFFSCGTRDRDEEYQSPRKEPPPPELKSIEKKVGYQVHSLKKKRKSVIDTVEGATGLTIDSQHLALDSQSTLRKKAIWDRLIDEERPEVFNHLNLAKDGGFSEVKELYNHTRWISAILLLFFVVYNIYYVLLLDIHLIWDQEAALADIGITSLEFFKERVEDRFYISRGLIDWLATTLLGLSEERVPSAVQVLGFLELLCLGYYFVFALYCLIVPCFDRGFKRWFYISYIFWRLLPTLSTYSAMKLLVKIVPLQFVAELYEKIVLLSDDNADRKRRIMGLLSWLLTVVVSFIVGFDTFLMKLRVVSHRAPKDPDGTDGVLPVLQFLFQIIGVVQLGPYVQKRLFVFIFGGEDGAMQKEEIEIMETWTALLAKRIWRENSVFKWLAVMLSFSDEDFQSLVLNEDAVKRQQSIGKGLVQPPGASSAEPEGWRKRLAPLLPSHTKNFIHQLY